MKKNATMRLAPALTLLLGGLAQASSLEADLNPDTLRVQYNFSDQNASLGVSAALMLTDDNGELGYFTLRTQGNLNNNRMVRGGFGGRAYFASPDDEDSFQSLGLGGFLETRVPNVRDLSIGAELYYSPSITSTDDVDNVIDVTFRVSYQLFDNAAAFAGVRSIEAEEDNTDDDIEFDDGAHIGFILQF